MFCFIPVATVTSSAFAGPIPRGSGGPHLSRLPFDLIIAIASYLPIRDRIALSETCRYVHSSIHDSPDLWRTLVHTTQRRSEREIDRECVCVSVCDSHDE